MLYCTISYIQVATHYLEFSKIRPFSLKWWKPVWICTCRAPSNAQLFLRQWNATFSKMWGMRWGFLKPCNQQLHLGHDNNVDSLNFTFLHKYTEGILGIFQFTSKPECSFYNQRHPPMTTVFNLFPSVENHNCASKLNTYILNKKSEITKTASLN